MTEVELKHLAQVCIFSKDLAEARDFCRDVLGMGIAFSPECGLP